MTTVNKKKLKAADRDLLLDALKKRFEQNMQRHLGINWSDVHERLLAKTDKLWTLSEMERTGGEPDVVGYHPDGDEYIFFDCAPQTPKGRVSVCYDLAALESRKEHRPQQAAVEMAQEMGIELLTEKQYRHLQSLGEFDTKTSSWLVTPADIRQLGGALFGDRRFGHVFVYHNGAQSYYAARGFRGCVRI